MFLFSVKLKESRLKKNQSLNEAAKFFGWTQMYYGRYENSRLLPNKKNTSKFADFMNLSEEELISIIEVDKNIFK